MVTAQKALELKRDAIYKRDRGVCQICHRRVARKALILDHIIPVSFAGTASEDNLRLVHKRCNSARGNSIPAQIRLPLSGQPLTVVIPGRYFHWCRVCNKGWFGTTKQPKWCYFCHSGEWDSAPLRRKRNTIHFLKRSP